MSSTIRRILDLTPALVLACVITLLAPPHAVAQDAAVSALTQAYNASGQQLFKQFAKSRGNIVFSPYSIGTATAMALSGARGETATQMARVLRQRTDRETMATANSTALAILNGYDKSAEAPSCADDMRWSGERCESPAREGRCPFMARREGELCLAEPVKRARSAQLRIANALMEAGQRNLVAKEYVALVKDKYGAEVLQGVGVNDVNDWVKRKTAGKIERIIDQVADVVLLNAVYFKARWEATFSKDATQDKPFNVSSTQKISVPTMARTGRYSVVTRANYRAIRLPYDVNELGMVIVLPNKIGDATRIGTQMTVQDMSKLFAELRAAPNKLVALSMPKFKTAYAADNLAAIFRRAGMTRAFDRNKADFSGITGKPPAETPFWIDEIRHRAVIEVMEDGTEAAAVTAISMRAGALPQREPEPETFRIDRPFLFYILDNVTGAVLFQGRISDPRADR